MNNGRSTNDDVNDIPAENNGLVALMRTGSPNLEAESTLKWDVNELIELQDKQPGYREIKKKKYVES